jgi:aspartate aminotransferase
MAILKAFGPKLSNAAQNGWILAAHQFAVNDPRAAPAGRRYYAGIVRGVPWWGVISSTGSPVLLVGGWTAAALAQPRSYNPVADTISALAAVGAADRWVMTWAIAAVGACYVVTALALRPAAPAGRAILIAVGIATIGVAANPERAGAGGSPPHTFWATVGFIAMAAWPAAGRIRRTSVRGPRVPYGLRPAVSLGATAVMAGLLGWFGAELISGGRQVGLAERVLAGTQAVWPLVVVLTCLGVAAGGWPQAGTTSRSVKSFKSLSRTNAGACPGTTGAPPTYHRVMPSLQLAGRMARLGTESAFEVLAQARAIEDAGGRMIHLEIGEPDFPTAPHIVEAAVEALRAGATHYVPAPGIPALRQAVAAFLERTGRMRVTPDRVIVTPGAKPIMFFTILALADEGDEVLYPDPGFPMYESITRFAGAVPVPVPLRERNGFRIDPGELEHLITDRSKLLILNSPHNPCGSALTRPDCEAIADVAQRHDLTVLSDEVYWAIRYGSQHASVLDVDGMADRTILLDGWSKTFAMTGWRLGFGVFPPALVEPVTRLAINSVSCTSAFSQYAAIAALEGPWQPVAEMVSEFRRRRDFIVAGLNDIPGISCLEPPGAFYAFPDITGTGQTSAELQAGLLKEAGVAALAGTAFGPVGEGFLRFSYANSVENIRSALEAIRAYLG